MSYHMYSTTYRLFDIFISVPQEEEEKKLIVFEEKLSMEYEAKRKIEQQKIRREFHNQKMNMDLLSYRMH